MLPSSSHWMATAAVSTSLSAGNGLLIRDRAAFERARNLNAVVFDKTGTLTEGRFGVSDIVVIGEADENAELAFAAAAESQSEHPIAHGIVAEAKDRGISWSRPSEVRNITGEGIVAKVDGEDIRIVSPGHLARTGTEISDPRLKQLESQGKTVVVLVRGNTRRQQLICGLCNVGFHTEALNHRKPPSTQKSG